METSSISSHDKEKQSLLLEVSDIERQLWASINSGGLLEHQVQNLYHRVCSSYERIILTISDTVNFQEVEYSLWKMHYKHIDEFRKQIKKGSTISSGHVEGLKLFLLEATEFYRSILMKIRSQSPHRICSTQNPEESGFLCHRFLICLGDLARYRELFGKSEVETQNWSVAAFNYLDASKAWPESGNPHNQLALLATYIGDEFLALYHCVRSLAIKEPFPDARNNLLHLLEKSRSSPLLCSDSRRVSFDFLRPSERTKPTNNLSNHGTSKLWFLLVRTMSFFYMSLSLDEFLGTFASAIEELEILMELDDTKLEAALRSNQFTGSTDAGPTRAVQAVCIFIFVIHNFSKKQSLGKTEEKYLISSSFVFMGRLVDRCLKSHPAADMCPLLPSVLVFTEWLTGAFDELALHGSNEKERAAVSYFFRSFIHLLNSLRTGKTELGFGDSAALWEDYELRGFTPLAKSHNSLDFSVSSPQVNSFVSGDIIRARRIHFAARKIAERSQKWIFYDNSRGRFSAAKTRVEEKPFNSLDEEEVILFKPLTRYNSAPVSDYILSKGHPLEGQEIEEPIIPSDECLRRTQTALEFKPFKQPETAVTAGPPSLSAWVLNGGSFGINKENHLSPVEELSSTILGKLSLETSNHRNPIRESANESVITHYPSPASPPPYLTPIPSAPLIPEDATWFSGMQQSSSFPDSSTGVSLHAGFSPHTSSGLMSSSEWLRRFREINNIPPRNGPALPPNLLGNFDAPAGPAWGNQVPLGPDQLVHSSLKPLLQPEFYQRPFVPYGCGGVMVNPVRDDQLSLLQYLKEREWRLQQDPSLQGPTFLGN